MTPNNNIAEAYSEYSSGLLGYIRSQVSNPEDAEDILHDVFYHLARATDDEGAEIVRVSSWLYRVARNTVLNFWRKRREIALDTEDAICEDIAQTLFCGTGDTPDNVFLRTLVWEVLEDSMAELPPEQAEVFSLTVFDRIPIKDISKATGVPVPTLLSRKHYAVKHLRHRFHDLYQALICEQ